MPTTEIVTLNLKPHSDIKDPNGAAATTLKECGATVASQPGLQNLWSGPVVQNSEKLQLFLNWNSKDDHDRFRTTDGYRPFLEKMSTIHTGDPDVPYVHVDFQPEEGVAEALSAPVTEIATFYYDKAPPETAFDGAETLLEALKKDGVKVMGWAFGTTYEEIEKDGVKGQGNILIVGWESVEAHGASHNTQALKDNIHLLTTPEVKTFEMHHVQAAA